ncbi:uncharacterized protein EI97DRAFT_65143 [Westerdykella ornata]|uniref:C2H2-type domain-containing protein n=1 Tax=Westerdykella ornata TaxID=318751 RepID=A0A6A6JGP9_WESOR|nr:uncharacterized protein EI97DRAFT_65143 [Westerdykella ornata]KAF2275602.1 hypothetical protein EI97DRAFT_65143 [Westerdykella ornata]
MLHPPLITTRPHFTSPLHRPVSLRRDPPDPLVAFPSHSASPSLPIMDNRTNPSVAPPQQQDPQAGARSRTGSKTPPQNHQTAQYQTQSHVQNPSIYPSPHYNGTHQYTNASQPFHGISGYGTGQHQQQQQQQQQQHGNALPERLPPLTDNFPPFPANNSINCNLQALPLHASSSSTPANHPAIAPVPTRPHFSMYTTASYPPPMTTTAQANGQYTNSASYIMGSRPLHSNPVYAAAPFTTLPDQEPVHVVGQQGRRGVLPTMNGRPQPTPRAPINVTKNAEGKYDCPHCTKSYQHLKHLKRHTLRHTGERPYSCALCLDTFSRSDILKRHFNKCSVRRGNPDNVTHLQYAQAHLRKPQRPTNGAGNPYMATATTSGPFTDAQYMTTVGHMAPLTHDGNNFADSTDGTMTAPQSLSARSSRSNSLFQPGPGAKDNRRSFPGFPLTNGSGVRPGVALGNHPLSNDVSPFATPGNAASGGGTFGYDSASINQPDLSQSAVPPASESLPAFSRVDAGPTFADRVNQWPFGADHQSNGSNHQSAIRQTNGAQQANGLRTNEFDLSRNMQNGLANGVTAAAGSVATMDGVSAVI